MVGFYGIVKSGFLGGDGIFGFDYVVFGGYYGVLLREMERYDFVILWKMGVRVGVL